MVPPFRLVRDGTLPEPSIDIKNTGEMPYWYIFDTQLRRGGNTADYFVRFAATLLPGRLPAISSTLCSASSSFR